MVVAVLTFLFIDIFDTIGTVLGVSHRADMVDEDGNVKNLNQAFMADAVGTIGAHRSQEFCFFHFVCQIAISELAKSGVCL